MLEKLILIEEELSVLMIEFLILLLAFHLIEVVHDSPRYIVRSVPPLPNQTMMKSKLQLPPVHVFIFRFVVKSLIVELGQISDVEVF